MRTLARHSITLAVGLILLAGLAALPAGAASPTITRIDLADLEPGSKVHERATPGKGFRPTLVNKIPGKKYTVETEISYREIPPLKLPDGWTLKVGQEMLAESLRPDGVKDRCAILQGAVEALEGTDSEKKVPMLAEKLKMALEEAEGEPFSMDQSNPAMMQKELGDSELRDLGITPGSGAKAMKLPAVVQLLNQRHPRCPGELISVANRTLDEVEQPLDAFILDPDQILTVRIRREGGPQWTVVYETPPQGEWLGAYGFTFVPDEDKRFFTKPSEDGMTFTITEKTDRRDLQFVPAIFYSYTPWKWRNNTLAGSLTGGLGFNTNEPVVFFGASASFHRNLSLLAGIAVRQHTELRGEYKVDQTLTQQLSDDALVEDTYKPTWFVGVSFRFGTNPFAKDQEKAKTPTMVSENDQAKGKKKDDSSSNAGQGQG